MNQEEALKFKLIMLLVIDVCFMLSCNNPKNDNRDTKSPNFPLIEVLYLKGDIETQKIIYCSEITKTSSRIIDTVINNNKIYNEIISQIDKLKRGEKDSSLECDFRMSCKIKYGKNDSLDLCIGKFNCILKNGVSVKSNDTLIYLVRRYSGYYNYFAKEELQYFRELKHFKIPIDYKCLKRVNTINSIPAPPE